MRIVLVTSSITYAPNNYRDVLDFVLSRSKNHLVGVVLVDINKGRMVTKIPYLYLAGCKNIAKTLFKNIISSISKTKERMLEKYAIPYINISDVNNHTAVSWVNSLKPDIVINMRTRCIFKNKILNIPKLGCVNVHHGLLPKQRGLFCDLNALAENKDTGFSIHKMVKKIDRGSIYYTEKIKPERNYIKYLKTCAQKEKEAVVSFINKIDQTGKLPTGTPNNCITPKITSTPSLEQIKIFQKKGMIL